MLAPSRSDANAAHIERQSPPDPFEMALAAARMEALATLQALLHTPLASAAEARERRLAAIAILKIPAPRTLALQAASPVPIERAPAAEAPAPSPPPARAQPPARPKPAAPSLNAEPIQPRPARREVSRLLCASGADSS